MAKIEYVPQWMGSNVLGENPLRAQIYYVTIERTAKGNDIVLYVETEQHLKYRISLWGTNLLNVIVNYGDESNNWLGRWILIHKETQKDGKVHKVIQC